MFTQLRESFAHLMNRMGSGAALSLIFLFSAPLWVQSTARAEVIVTEIMSNPSTGTEWIELTTKGEETADISNFTLYDAVSSPSLLVTFPENTILHSNTASVIEIDSAKLNNSGDAVVLYTPEGTEVFNIIFEASEKGLSWQRTLNAPTYFQTEPNPGEFSAEIVSAVPSPSAGPSPVPSQQPVSENLPQEENSSSQTTHELTEELIAQQTALESTLTTLLGRDTSFTYEPLETKQDVQSNNAEPQTFTRKQLFEPPRSSAVSLIGGGILISSVSYIVLYVLEQKEIFP